MNEVAIRISDERFRRTIRRNDSVKTLLLVVKETMGTILADHFRLRKKNRRSWHNSSVFFNC